MSFCFIVFVSISFVCVHPKWAEGHVWIEQRMKWISRGFCREDGAAVMGTRRKETKEKKNMKIFVC